MDESKEAGAMSEYPKALILEGKTHILDFGSKRHCYRADSPEEEARIIAEHNSRVLETKRELEELDRHR